MKKAVYKDFGKISSEVATHIVQKIYDSLVSNPRGSECKRLKGKKYESIWRYRVQDYRVFYEIIEDEKKIIVGRVIHRSKAY